MQDEIQATDNIVGDISRVLLDKYFPSKSVSAPVAEPPAEPIAAKPLLGSTALTVGSPLVIVAGLVICYFAFVKK